MRASISLKCDRVLSLSYTDEKRNERKGKKAVSTSSAATAHCSPLDSSSRSSTDRHQNAVDTSELWAPSSGSSS